MSVLEYCPEGPAWRLNWAELRERFSYVDALHACPQDATYHAEGDVGIHTEMALQALLENQEFRRLPVRERRIVFAAVLLHDVAKPMCTKEEDGRISSRGHSSRGAIFARHLLWRDGVEPRDRELICSLIARHQLPFFLVERDDCQRLAFASSLETRCDLLALVAQADGEGRRTEDPADGRRILENVELFREYCQEQRCYDRARKFPSDHSRFLYFRKSERAPDYSAHDDTLCRVVVLCGLPAAGKDTWAHHHAQGMPVISLDGIRRELGVSPDAPQGRVVAAARERARENLRAKTDFIWNATNVGRPVRQTLVELLASYNARIDMVYLECDAKTLGDRNRARESPVPAKVYERLYRRWTVPSLVEAHSVTHEFA